jgi:hypothetical protein
MPWTKRESWETSRQIDALTAEVAEGCRQYNAFDTKKLTIALTYGPKVAKLKEKVRGAGGRWEEYVLEKIVCTSRTLSKWVRVSGKEAVRKLKRWCRKDGKLDEAGNMTIGLDQADELCREWDKKEKGRKQRGKGPAKAPTDEDLDRWAERLVAGLPEAQRGPEALQRAKNLLADVRTRLPWLPQPSGSPDGGKEGQDNDLGGQLLEELKHGCRVFLQGVATRLEVAADHADLLDWGEVPDLPARLAGMIAAIKRIEKTATASIAGEEPRSVEEAVGGPIH